MRKYYPIFKKCFLFSQLSDEMLENVLDKLDTSIVEFPKNAVIRQHEVAVTRIGIVLRGEAYTAKFDAHGTRFILDEIIVGQTFGEALAFTDVLNSPISIISAGCCVAFISAKKLEGLLGQGEEGALLTQGLIRLLAQKTIQTQMKIDILSQKSIRKKLLLYFEYEQKTAGSKAFRIQFSREELADFLCLNPSALSRELGKMRDEGIITFKRNRFVLKK